MKITRKQLRQIIREVTEGESEESVPSWAQWVDGDTTAQSHLQTLANKRNGIGHISDLIMGGKPDLSDPRLSRVDFQSFMDEIATAAAWLRDNSP